MKESPLDKIKDAAKGFFDRNILGNVSDVGSERITVRKSNQLLEGGGGSVHDVANVNFGIHNILMYDQYDPSSGLYVNDESLSFCFEVIPQTGANDEMATRLNSIFTPIPPGYGVQWTMLASPVLDNEFEIYKALRMGAVSAGLSDEFFVELAKRRERNVVRRKGKPHFGSDNFTISSKRLVFSVTKSIKGTTEETVHTMKELRATLESTLRTAHLPAYPMDAEALIGFVWPILNPETMFDDGLSVPAGYDDTRSISSQMTGLGNHIKVKSKEILFGLPPATEAEPDGRIAARSYGVLRYPRRKELWQMGGLIGAAFEDQLQYPCPYLISSGVFTLDPNRVETKVQIRTLRALQNAGSKMANLQPELAEQLDDWRSVSESIRDGKSLCEMYHTLTLFAPKNMIDRAANSAISIWRAEGISISPLEGLHLPILYSALPMTLSNEVRGDLEKMRLIGTKTTINAVDLSPVVGEWRGAGDPVMMFFGRRGTPVFLDFFSNKQGNYNGFIAGVSGSGKSVLMNEIISAYRGVGAKVTVIDVGRSYKNLIALQKGTFIEFKSKGDLCMNPFSWVGIDDELDFDAEMRMLKPMIARMASPNEDLSAYRYAIIEQAITAVWAENGNETDPTKIAEYLLTQVFNERNEIDKDAFQLGTQLQPFTVRGVYGKYFNGPATINLDGDMIGLELEELKDAPDLRRVVLFVLISRIASDMYLSRHRKKILVVDEAWQLLGNDKETAAFIAELFRRARKYNGSAILGTQGIEDAYANEASQAAYNNADWKIYLRQDAKNFEKMINDGVVSFSPGVKRTLLSLSTEGGRYSELMISSPNGDHVVRHIPDPFSLLMASTNAKDFSEVNELIDGGMTTMQAIGHLLQMRGVTP